MKQDSTTRRSFLRSGAAICTLACSIGSIASQARAAQGPLISQDLYKEIMRYRTQTDRNTKAIRKLDHILTAIIENHYDPLDDRIESIDSGTDGKGGVLGILSFGSRFLPAKYKRVGRTIQIFDFGSQKIKSIKHQENSVLPSWRDSLNKNVDLLYEIIEGAPNDETREKYIATVNKYLAKDLGGIDATQDEVLDQFPDFKDHMAVRELVDETGTNITKEDFNKIVGEISEISNGLKQLNEARISDEERRMSEAEFQQKLREIENVTSIGNFIVAVLRRKDPEFAAQAEIALNAYSQGSKMLAAMSKHGDSLSQVAGAANLTLLSLNVVSALSSLGQKNPDQLIMESLQELKEIVLEATETILESIDMLGDQIQQAIAIISLVYNKVQQNANSLQIIGNDIENAKNRLLASDERISTQIRTLEERNLARLILDANGQKQTVPPRLWEKSSIDFREQATKLQNFAVVLSRDELSIDNSSRSYKLEDVGTELSNLTPIRNLSYLVEVVDHHFTKGGSLLPRIDFDPVTLFESALALSELIQDWPEYQQDINANILESVVSDFDLLISLSSSFKFADGGGYTSLVYTSIQQSAIAIFRKYLEGLEDTIGDTLSERLRAVDRVLGRKYHYSELDSFIGRFKFVDFVWQHDLKGTVPVKANFPEGHWKGTYDLVLPASKLSERLPRDIQAGYSLGLIDLRCHFTNDNGNGIRHIRTVASSQLFDDPGKEFVLFEGWEAHPPTSASSNGISIVIAPTYSSAFYNQTAQELFSSLIARSTFDIGTAKYDPNSEEITALRGQLQPFLEDVFQSVKEPSQRQFNEFGHARHLVERGPGIPAERVKGRDLISQFESTLQIYLLCLFIGENSILSRNDKIARRAEELANTLRYSIDAVPEVSSGELIEHFEEEFRYFDEMMARASADERYLNRDRTPFSDFAHLLPKLKSVQNGLKNRDPVSSLDYAVRRAHVTGLVRYN